MRAAECRAETYDIHAGVLAENDRTLEAGVVYLHNTLFTVLLFVDFLQKVEYLALRFGSQPPYCPLKTVFIPAMLKQLSSWAEI